MKCVYSVASSASCYTSSVRSTKLYSAYLLLSPTKTDPDTSAGSLFGKRSPEAPMKEQRRGREGKEAGIGRSQEPVSSVGSWSSVLGWGVSGTLCETVVLKLYCTLKLPGVLLKLLMFRIPGKARHESFLNPLVD